MFANSVISRSSISISSLLLSFLFTFFSLLTSSLSCSPPPLSFALLLSIFFPAFYVLLTRFFLSSGFARATSAVYSCRYALSRHIRSLDDRSPRLSRFFPLSFHSSADRPSFPPSLTILLPHLSFICHTVQVSVSSISRRLVRKIHVTRDRSAADYLPSLCFFPHSYLPKRVN